MLKKILPAAAAIALFAAPGLAAVTGSHHDLQTWSGGTTQEVCLFCHGVTSTVTNTTDYGAIGDLCVSRCHAGAAGYAASAATIPNRPAVLSEAGALVGPTATLDAVNVNAGYAHGLERGDLYNRYGAGAPLAFDAIGNGLPYAAGPMQCTSCHNVHDYANTPFLQRNLFTGGPAARPSFCEACHTSRGNSWAGGETAPNGEHPTNFGLVLGDSGRTNAERITRYIALDTATTGERIFDVSTPNGTGLSASGSNYVTGGKVSGWGTAVAGSTFGCYTCHSAHMDNNGAPNTPNLILGNGYSVNGEWNPLCVGCHGDVANGLDDPNPGAAASLYYHPVGTTAAAAISNTATHATFPTSTGSFQFAVNLNAIRTIGLQGALADGLSGIAGGATNPGTATTFKPRCTSCHDVHGGINNSQALIDLDGTRDGAYTGSICDRCHDGSGLPDVADNAGQAGEAKLATGQGSHHRTRTTSWAAGTITDADGDSLTMNAPSWAAATTASLGCADCHVFYSDVHQNAHNW